MAYIIECRTCSKETWARSIVDLIKNHTVPIVPGALRFKCAYCGGTDTFIYRRGELQERDKNGKKKIWERWIKGILVIDSGVETYTPYIFLISMDGPDGEISSMHFSYYKDTRPQGGALKHGHGPGGGPVFHIEDFLYVLKLLVGFSIFSKIDLKKFLDSFDEPTS